MQNLIKIAINNLILNFHDIFSRKNNKSNTLYFQCIKLFPLFFLTIYSRNLIQSKTEHVIN